MAKVAKDEAILLMEEANSIEEVPNLTNLDEIESMILDSSLDKKTIKELRILVEDLKKESIDHANAFNGLIKHILKSGKNEF